jgi:predicted DNA-binding protein (UPF0251 family)
MIAVADSERVIAIARSDYLRGHAGHDVSGEFRVASNDRRQSAERQKAADEEACRLECVRLVAELNMSQERIAELTGWSRQWIGRFLSSDPYKHAQIPAKWLIRLHKLVLQNNGEL